MAIDKVTSETGKKSGSDLVIMVNKDLAKEKAKEKVAEKVSDPSKKKTKQCELGAREATCTNNR